MTRDEAMAQILRRAHREHGTCVLTVRRLEHELADLRRYVARHADNPGDRAHVGYLVGVANMIELIEEALFDVFNVRPPDRDDSWWGRLPRLDGLPLAWRPQPSDTRQ